MAKVRINEDLKEAITKLKEGDVIETDEFVRTHIFITQAFKNESCSYCERVINPSDLCGRYAFQDCACDNACSCTVELVTLCVNCVAGE